MDSFLERIDGRSSEDLTTEVLGYILTNHAYAPYQRLFYSLIFQDAGLKDTEEQQFEITTQMSFEGLGRPDIIIEGKEEIVFIENKFYASFNLENQMYRYFNFLKENYEKKNKYLILLTIKDRIPLYFNDIRKQFEVVFPISSNQELLDYCSENGVQLQSISWEHIFRLFGNSDFLVDSLINYIQNKYITSTILNEREIELINSKEVPLLMEKLWAGIDKIRDILVGENYKVLRTSQSRLFYCFPIERFWGKIYVNYYHNSWRDYNSPYTLQIRSEWVKEEHKSTEFESQVKSIGFLSDKEMGLILPIHIEEADLVGNAAETIKEKVNQLDNIFDLTNGLS